MNPQDKIPRAAIVFRQYKRAESPLGLFCNIWRLFHFLARKAIYGSELPVWIESYPDDIAPLVTCDAL